MPIQVFGLELRRTNVVSLYADVDRVLEQAAGGDGRPVPRRIQALAVAHALQHMMRPEGYCDVCAIRESAKIANIVIPEERISLYHTMHCIYWNAMTPEYRNELAAMILDDFRPILLPPTEGI